MPAMSASGPSLAELHAAQQELSPWIRRTPTWRWHDDRLQAALGPQSAVHLKLELWQHTGSFKPRGALLAAAALSAEARSRGFTAVSAGNHAMAVAYAATRHATTAKVVMPNNANRARVQACRDMGAEVVLVADVHAAFAEAERIVEQEGRTLLHPFEGRDVAVGTGTIGVELMDDVPELDAVIVPIGGGGLCGGIANAVKLMRPECEVFGVEPEGADSMHRSFAAGAPAAIDSVQTIADSLGAPYAAQYSFELCREHVDALVKVDDDQICQAMAMLFDGMKLAVEPAAAASTAALLGPLRERLQGKSVGLIVCGANIDAHTFGEYVQRGLAKAG